MTSDNKTLGILGGLGPMSSVYFYEMLTEHTKADCDQDHLNILLSSRASTPDRTEFIMGRSEDNPIYVMRSDVAALIGAGADIIAIPCNTAHYFYEAISAAASVPVINIIRETAMHCRRLGLSRVGILATEGTICSEAYENIFSLAQIECLKPSEQEQKIISDIIYGQIKRGLSADMEAFARISEALLKRGCERLILGCTELSLLKKRGELEKDIYIDSLEVLAYSAIKLCGKTPVGFDLELMEQKTSAERKDCYAFK